MHPSQHQLKQPDPGLYIDSWINLDNKIHLLKYSREMVKGLVRRHQPNLTPNLEAEKFRLRLTKKDLNLWQRFVQMKPNDIQSPLTVYNRVGALGLFDILGQVNVNFSTILHVRGEARIIDRNYQATPGHEVTVASYLDDIIVKKRQFILVVATDVYNEHDEVIRHHKDFWFVKKCDKKYLEAYEHTSNYDVSEFSGLSKRQATLAIASNTDDTIKKALIPISKSAGREYAKVSGDYNIVHTTNLGARITGQKRAFLQGYGVMNLCIHHLSQLAQQPISNIKITFCKPTFVDQTAELFVHNNNFELCDCDGQVLSAGSFSTD